MIDRLKARTLGVLLAAAARLEGGARQDAVTRADPSQVHGGVYNPVTGLGMAGMHPATQTVFAPPVPLEHDESFAIYRQGGLFARVIDLPIREALRQGWTITGVEGEDSEAILADGEALDAGEDPSCDGISGAVRKWATWGDVCGGAAIVLVCEDGLDPSEPLNEARSELRAVRVLSRRDLQPEDRDWDLNSETYGQVVLWRVGAPGATPVVMHHSRLILYGHSSLPSALPLADDDGWADSRYTGAIRRCLAGIASDAAASHRLVETWEIVAHKMPGLGESVSQGGNAVFARLGFDAFITSLFRRIALDTDEEIQRIGANAQGLAEIIRLGYERLSADTGYPLTLLFGQPPSGLSTDNVSGTRHFYDYVVAAYQEHHFRRALERVYGLRMRSSDGPIAEPAAWRVSFEPLYQMDPEQAARIEEIQTRSVVEAAKEGLVLPGEASARLGANGLVTLDEASREAQARAAGSTEIAPIEILRQGRLGLDALHTPATADRFAELLGVSRPTDEQMRDYWLQMRGTPSPGV